jgi:MbtH protein
MVTEQHPDNSIFQVVVNQEGQYSLWFANQELPLGWSATGKPGTKDECLAYVEEVWTDMTPISLRKKAGGTG